VETSIYHSESVGYSQNLDDKFVYGTIISGCWQALLQSLITVHLSLPSNLHLQM